MKAVQIIRLIIAALCLFLIVRWFSVPGWEAGKIPGIIIMLGVAVILFSGKRFTDAYLKNLGGEGKFDYREWKSFFVVSVMLFGIAAILWSFGSISGPILAIAALLTRPVLTFTVCRKKD